MLRQPYNMHLGDRFCLRGSGAIALCQMYAYVLGPQPKECQSASRRPTGQVRESHNHVVSSGRKGKYCVKFENVQPEDHVVAVGKMNVALRFYPLNRSMPLCIFFLSLNMLVVGL